MVYTVCASDDAVYDNMPIHTIRIQSMSPMVTEHEKYDYITENDSEIKYITHFLESMEVTDGNVIVVSDGNSLFIELVFEDNSRKLIDVYYNGMRVKEGKEYKEYVFSGRGYAEITGLIYALKSRNLVISDDISFSMSEWAKADIDMAINNNLLPPVNQIGYQERINRLEVCQLIENLLEKENVAAIESSKNPFSDTSSDAVACLFNYGIIDGKNETEFAPWDYITREEVAKILVNTYKLLNENDVELNNELSYADSSEISDWAVPYVSLVSSLGIFKGDENGCFNPKANITKEEFVVALLRLSNGLNVNTEIQMSEENALEIADGVFSEKFGHGFIEKTKVSVEETDDTYIVCRWEDDEAFGGDVTIVIGKKDGSIISITAGE